MLFPVIGFGEHETKVSVNFGDRPFSYDIDDHDWTQEQLPAIARRWVERRNIDQ